MLNVIETRVPILTVLLEHQFFFHLRKANNIYAASKRCLYVVHSYRRVQVVLEKQVYVSIQNYLLQLISAGY